MAEGLKRGGGRGHEAQKDHLKIEPVLRELSMLFGAPGEAH